jgi:hypothetical protein
MKTLINKIRERHALRSARKQAKELEDNKRLVKSAILFFSIAYAICELIKNELEK